ncbi:DUF1257 domain-containing protein [Planctomicrobium sp. SH527]|uniref:DUF1257 domain-containing protein n=1 Tax=Planctomicrobium sp. SH527 TaxID=3448123 RepID=UPI003F5B95F9
MSTVLVVAPIVIANWSAISAAVVAGVGALGFVVASSTEISTESSNRQTGNRAEIEVENSEILATGVIPGQEIVVQKDGVTVRFSRDRQGALKVCVEGEGLSKSQLKQIGEDLIGVVTQQYAYHRIMTEMKNQNMTVVHEEVDTDRTVRIRVRNV